MTKLSPAWRVRLLLIGVLLILTPFVQASGQTSGTTPQSAGVPYADYGLSALSSNDRITLDALRAWTANNLTVAGFEGYIQHNLTPYDLRRVLLDIGWQNYSAGAIPEEAWVSDWLTACDAMGVQNVIYVGPLTTDGVGSPWIKNVIAMDPTAQTYLSNGSAAPFISYNNPDVAIFLEKDLATIYSYYGSHPSWVGIGTGSSANDPYYRSGLLYPGMGYSNLTISSFVNSPYYSSDVNGSGFLPNGQMDPLWASYKNVQPSISLSSGVWTTSFPVNVYGNGSLSNYLEMRFQLLANVSSLSISWYGYVVGSPGPMVIDLHADTNGSLDHSKLLASYAVVASSYANTPGWQSGPTIQINMTSGYYWATLSSPTSNKSNYFAVYMKDQATNFTAYAQESYVGPGFQHGSSILWLKNQAGISVALYPYQQAVVGNPTTQRFTAHSVFSFNTVLVFLSDRIYNPTNGTFTVTDVSANDKVLATGILSQQLGHGLEGWVPISLNATVKTNAGDVYAIQLTEPKGGYSWIVALRGISTNPSSAGFQGQDSSWLFQLAELSWVQGHLDFIDMTTNGVDAVTSGYLDAVRIVPSSNETLNSVSILMASDTQSGNYTSGTFSISIWNSSSSGLTPSSPLSQGVAVSAKEVPHNGWLNASGFNQPVRGGGDYWVVFSANSNDSFSMARFTNSYAFDVQVSLDGGAMWQEPREGPTDFGFVVSLSNQKLGNFVSAESGIQIGSTGYFAEPFYANKTTQVSGVYLGRLTAGGLLSVSINPDTESNQPSLSPIASDAFNTINVTLSGPQFVQFSSVADLTAGQKYWLVVHPLTGSYNLFPLVYLPNAPNVPPNLPSVVSQDGGLTWDKVSNNTSTLVYQLTSPPVQLPEFATSALAGYLSSYHSPPVSEGVIHGWTGYIAASELSLFGQITHWLNTESGREFRFYGRGEANVLNQLSATNGVLLPASASSNSCSGLRSELSAEIPVAGVQYYNVANSSLLAECAGTNLGPILQQLGYVLGTGRTYGQTSATRVLVVGDMISENLTRNLSIAYNATYSQLSLDPSLSKDGSLSKYAAIVWTSNQSPSSALESRLARYVKAGGTFVLAQFGGDQGKIRSLSASLPVDNATLSPPRPALLTAITAHTSYGGLSVNTSSTETQGDSAEVSITIHNYGVGKYYLVWFSATVASQVSDPTVVLSNIVAGAVALPDPFWYGAGSPSPNPTIQFNAMKTSGGPILVWLANTGEQNVTFSIHLNGSYYGVASTWKELNLNDLGVSTGSGSDLVLSGNLAPGNWLPVFIIPYPSAALIDYSSIQVSGQFVYPHQSFYKLSPVNGQEALLLISSNTTASQLLIDDNQSLPSLQSVSAFSHASSGWVYYGNSSTFLVKFASSGESTLRLLALTEPVQVSTPLPMQTLVVSFVALLGAEVAALVLMTFHRWRSRRSEGPLRHSSGAATNPLG